MYDVKIVAVDAYGVNPGDLSWAPISELGHLDVYDTTLPEQLSARCGKADAVLVNRLHIGSKELELMPNLKYIGAFATGYNFIDVEACRRRGVIVTNIPAYSTMSVAQMTMALLLEICQHPAYYDSLVRRGQWSGEPGFNYQPYPILELAGKRIGIIGFGHIGQAVARMASAFGMKVALFTSRREDELPAGYEKMTLEQLMSQSDVVSVHCPLTESTRGLISAAMIARMKESAIFINTSRGAIADEGALAEALRSGRIYAAGVDVLSKEPPKDGNPLLLAPNCVITPHVAWASREARIRSIALVAANLKAYLEGALVNVVD